MRRPACLALTAALLAAGCGAGGGGTRTAATAAPSLHGFRPTSAAPRPSFVLSDTEGRRFDFASSTGGRVTLLYFGYTHCPDECPTTMADIAAALRRLPAATAGKVLVVFVTTDPQRDSARVLRTWLDRFDPHVVGLRGSADQVRAAEQAVGVPLAERDPATGSSQAGGYSVSHFAAAVAYGRDDRVAALYPSGVTAADYAADLSVLVEGEPSK